MLKLIFVAIALLAIAFAGIAIKMFFIKDATFQKSCSSINPQSGERMGCSCGGEETTSCENK
jgi:hypothetical protein